MRRLNDETRRLRRVPSEPSAGLEPATPSLPSTRAVLPPLAGWDKIAASRSFRRASPEPLLPGVAVQRFLAASMVVGSTGVPGYSAGLRLVESRADCPTTGMPDARHNGQDARPEHPLGCTPKRSTVAPTVVRSCRLVAADRRVDRMIVRHRDGSTPGCGVPAGTAASARPWRSGSSRDIPRRAKRR